MKIGLDENGRAVAREATVENGHCGAVTDRKRGQASQVHSHTFRRAVMYLLTSPLDATCMAVAAAIPASPPDAEVESLKMQSFLMELEELTLRCFEISG